VPSHEWSRSDTSQYFAVKAVDSERWKTVIGSPPSGFGFDAVRGKASERRFPW
jgi:hypothetical protein